MWMKISSLQSQIATTRKDVLIEINMRRPRNPFLVARSVGVMISHQTYLTFLLEFCNRA